MAHMLLELQTKPEAQSTADNSQLVHTSIVTGTVQEHVHTSIVTGTLQERVQTSIVTGTLQERVKRSSVTSTLREHVQTSIVNGTRSCAHKHILTELYEHTNIMVCCRLAQDRDKFVYRCSGIVLLH